MGTRKQTIQRNSLFR